MDGEITMSETESPMDSASPRDVDISSEVLISIQWPLITGKNQYPVCIHTCMAIIFLRSWVRIGLGARGVRLGSFVLRFFGWYPAMGIDPLLPECHGTSSGSWMDGATKHRIGYIGCIGHIGVQIILLLDMTQYKVVKGKRLGSVLVKQSSRAKPGWGLGRGRAPRQNIIRLRCVRCIRCGVSSHPWMERWIICGVLLGRNQ